MNRLIHDYLNSKYNNFGLNEYSSILGQPTVYVKFTYTALTGEQIGSIDFIELTDLMGFMYETFNPLPTKP